MGAKFHAWWLKYGFRVVTGLGVVGMAGSAGLACWATYQSVRKVDRLRAELGRELTRKEKFKECWKFYIPATAIGAVSGGCIIGASRQSAKINASLTAAYAESQAALVVLNDKISEKVGQKKVDEIHRAVVEEKMNSVPAPTSQQIVVMGKDPTLVFDKPSGRYFKGTYEKVKRAELEIDARVAAEDAVFWNDFYWALKAQGCTGQGIDRLPPDLGQNKGFVAHGISHSMNIKYDTMLLEEEGEVCLTIDYEPEWLDWGKIRHGDGM